MNEIQYGQTVAAEEEWLYEQEQRKLMDALEQEQAMREVREKDEE